MGKKRFLSVLGLMVIIGVLGVSYAFLQTERRGNTQNLGVANFGLVISKDIEAIALKDAYPMTDEEGLKNQSTFFQIKNEGSITAYYKLSLIDKDVLSTLDNESIRYQLTRIRYSETDNEERTVLDVKNLAFDGLIDEGLIEPDEKIGYELVMWIDYNVSINSKLVFAKVISLEGSQISSLDVSGANPPELLENMIPVYYDKTSDTTGVWRKADATNRNDEYKWYNYDAQMWANAVTVKDINTYQDASLGTEIKSDNITSMWVWIPRYRYTIFNGNNETVNEKTINVKFEHGIETTGTVICEEENGKETCLDNTKSNLINGISTYTHPAFTFGEEELTGLWVSKFEMSTDDKSCLDNQNVDSCNKNNLNVYSLPDKVSLRYINNENLEQNIENMQKDGNIHGFNSKNEYNIHMIKNMEWGAVAYLSQSKYGKSGNGLYQGANKEIYLNNYYENDTEKKISIYKTGYSGKSANAKLGTDSVLYNDLTLTKDAGYLGAGASTTGNIYGVYDMNGGALENVMGKVISQEEKTLSKYVDLYQESSSSDIKNSVLNFKLGDATKEVMKSFTNNNSVWYKDYNEGITNWLQRGNAGIFSFQNTTGTGNSSAGSRAILTVSHKFPWIAE